MTKVVKNAITVTGKSGANYTFTIHSDECDWNKVPGVYLVLWKAPSPSDMYDPVYVGETENLAVRFSGHHKESCFMSHKWTHLAFMHEGSKEKRLSVEQDILKNYPWPCND